MTAPEPYDHGSQRQAPTPYTPQPVSHRQHAQAPSRPGVQLTAAGMFWYVIGNIAFGAMYFAKVPAKKALEEAGLCQMTGAERFWYVLQCIGFGAGYFAKLPVKKALAEVPSLG